MKLLGIFLTACVVLAAAQAAAAVLCILLLAALIYGLFKAPREMFGLLALLSVAGLLQAQPLAFLATVIVLALAKIVHKAS